MKLLLKPKFLIAQVCYKRLGFLRLNCRSLSSKIRYGSHAPNLLPFSAAKFEKKMAIVDSNRSYTYAELLILSNQLKGLLQTKFDFHPHERIAFITPNDASYTVCQWAIWLGQGIAVPLCATHPPSEIEYVLENSQSNAVISVQPHNEVMEPISKQLNIHHISISSDFMLKTRSRADDDETFGCEINEVDYLKSPAMLIYTSGTTGRPKGVLHTHSSLYHQVKCMVEAWKWTSNDVLLHVLPLHHIHGIVNLLMCPLSVGATVVMDVRFKAAHVWECFLGKRCPDINVFMAVPTIYAKLIEYFKINKLNKDEVKDKCRNIRVMVSGSASLPQPVLNRWKETTDHTLLERYGMTEFGMALTNPYDGIRIPGAVGLPFPGIEAKIYELKADGNIDLYKCIVHVKGTEVVSELPGYAGRPGELLIKSPTMFQSYWNNPEATSDSFINDGWFRTGDTATFVDNVFRITGRSSVDVIKSGGFKISALEIERQLLHHQYISEAIVFGIPNEIWGQKIVAIVKVNAESSLDELELQRWCKGEMANYKIPKEIKFLKDIPKNAMGKINKKRLATKYFPRSS